MSTAKERFNNLAPEARKEVISSLELLAETIIKLDRGESLTSEEESALEATEGKLKAVFPK